MGNSSSKPDPTSRDGKVAKQSKMRNNSAYNRMGNNTIYLSLQCLRRLSVKSGGFVGVIPLFIVAPIVSVFSLDEVETNTA